MLFFYVQVYLTNLESFEFWNKIIWNNFIDGQPAGILGQNL
jgi:hypothetical protein